MPLNAGTKPQAWGANNAVLYIFKLILKHLLSIHHQTRSPMDFKLSEKSNSAEALVKTGLSQTGAST